MNPVAIPLSTHTSRFRTLSAKGWSLLVLLSGLFLFAQDASGQCSVNADPNSAMNPLQDTLLLYGDTLVLNQSAVLGTINSISDAGTCTSCALEFYNEATSTWQDSLLLDCNSSDTFLIRANSSNDSGCESDTVFLEITVIDVADPIIVNCPSDITVSITSDSCYYDMLLPRPDTVTDNCELDSMFVAFTGTSPSGSVTVPADFGIQSMATIVNFLDTVAPFDTLFSFFASPDSCAGVTNVAYTFFDRTGNIATCDFNVIVQGIYKPVWDDPRMSRLGAGYNLLDSISSELDTTVYTSGWASGDSSRSLTIYLDCTSPTYDADTAWLAQFAPTALDSCGTTVVVVGDSSEWTGYVDEMCTTYDATNNVKFTNFTRYWTVKETCSTTYASNDTFRLIVRTVDQTPPYLHHDTAGVKVPSMVLMDASGSHSGIDSTWEWFGDTIRFYTSGEYGTNPNWCGVTIGDDTLSIIGVDCHDSLEYSWKIDSSFDFRGDPIMWTVDSAGGNDIADSIMTWPVGWHYFKYYVEDSCGNISFFHVRMNIIDDTPPSFATCPEDTVLAADVGCQKLHIWDIPTVEDSCLLDTVYVQTIDPAGQINAVTVTDTLPTGKAFAVFPVGPSTVHYIAIDTFGNSDTCTFIVTVNDSLDPVARAMALTRGLDNNGEVIVQADEFDDNSSDNCTADENLIFKAALDTGVLVFVDSLEFNCSDAGTTYDVQLLVSDTFGNTDTVATTITINDDTPPVVVCQRDTAYLSASGSASIAPANVDGGSTDNCGIDSMWVDIDEFFCTDIGENTVVFSVRDGSGNLATCNAVVEVLDTTSPTANCRSADTIYLDDMGQGTLTASDIDNASSDNCTVDNLSIDVTEFDCANVGTPQTVTLTVTDQDGNTSTCTSQVTAQDTVAPEVICDEVILSLTSTDSVITPAFVEDQSDDNCTAVTLSVDRDSFSCEDLGQTIMVTLYAQDDHGNIDSCVAEVTVTEDVQPTAVCRTDTLTVTLNAIGNGSVSVGDIDNGSFDLCGAPDSMFVTPSAFGCDDLGLNTVVLYVQDDEGNSDFCQATVDVVDPSVPFVTCDPHTAYVDSMGSVTVDAFEFEKAAGGVGPCGPIVQRLFRVVGHPTADVFATQHTFTCDDDLGLHVVVYKIVTSDGKEDSCNTTLTIEDVIEPIAVCADITIDLSDDLGAGMVSLVPDQIDDDTWDNCDYDLAISKVELNSFGDSVIYDCMDEENMLAPGDILEVVLRAQDASGNAGYDTCSVVVQDVTEPEIACGTGYVLGIPDSATVDADTFFVNTEEGTCEATLQWVVPQVADNCGIDSFEVLIIDEVTNDTVEHDVIGEGDTLEYTFTGEKEVVYNVYDKAGNVNTCGFLIYIIDEEAPMITCPPNDTIGTSNLMDTMYECTGDYQWVHPTPTDNCAVSEMTVSYEGNGFVPEVVSAGDTLQWNFPKGENSISYQVTDGSGNIATCSFTVTVVDDEAPMIENVPNDITLSVINGECFNIYTWLRPSRFDNCDPENAVIFIEEISDQGVQDAVDAAPYNFQNYLNNPSTTPLPQANFSIGTTVIKYTAIDSAGNVTVDSFTVTIEDDNAPIFTNCEDDELPSCPNAKVPSYLGTPIDECALDSVWQMPLAGESLGDLLPADSIYIGFEFDVTVYAVDIFGNMDSCVITITLNNDDTPVPAIMPLTAIVTACGEATVSAPIATNCSGDTIYGIPLNLGFNEFQKIGDNPDVYLFTFNGTRNVTWIYPDPVTGNTASQLQPITITPDIGLPQIACPPSDTFSTDTGICTASIGGIGLTGGTFGSLMPGQYADSCDIEANLEVTYELSGATVVAQTEGTDAGAETFNTGTTSVTYTVTDRAGNSASCTFTVTVEDNEAPVLTGQTADVTVDCDAITTPADVTATDNCTQEEQIDIAFSEVVNAPMGSCPYDYTIVRKWVATDLEGNADSLVQTITVQDTTAPVFTSVPDIVVGNDFRDCGAEVAVTYTENNATDNCTAGVMFTFETTLDMSPVQFGNGDVNFYPVGTTLVYVHAEDSCGNVTTDSFNITVNDTEEPLLGCVNSVTFPIPAGGLLVLAPLDIIQVLNDNCTADPDIILTLAQDSFTCDDATGQAIPVTITATDAVGNSSSCVTNVTIQENVPPTAVCEDITASLDAQGVASIDAEDLDGGSFDNCATGITFMASRTSFNCGDKDSTGGVMVVLTVTDPSGNSNTCTATVTVADTTAPFAECQDVTAYLDGDGNATVSADDVDNGSTDNCDGNILFLIDGQSSLSYTCSDIGVDSVMFTATDDDMNGSTCAATVTVVDTVAPTAVCIDITIMVDGGGTATVTPDDIDDGSSDVCDGTDLILALEGADSLIFDCEQFGANTVTLTATDGSGNVGSCQATVFVMPSDTVVVNLPEISGPAGTTISVPITVENFYLVDGIQFGGRVVYDTVAEIVDVVPYGALNSASSTFSTNVTSTTFNVSWYDVMDPKSLADGDTIAFVQVHLVGVSGDETPIEFVDDAGGSFVVPEVTQGCIAMGMLPVAMPLNYGQNGMITIDSFTTVTISGTISFWKQGVDTFPNCLVKIMYDGETDSVYTDQSGYYEVIVPVGKDVVVMPQRDENVSNGVLTSDALAIQLHLLSPGNPVLVSPYQFIAADVNGTENVTISDAGRIQSLAILLIPDFKPQRESWTFVDASYVFADPTIPFPYPDTIAYPNILANQPNTDFIGVKMGDVTGNAKTNMAVAGPVIDNRSGNGLTIGLEDRKLTKGEIVEMVFTAQDFTTMNAMQYTLSYDKHALKMMGFSQESLQSVLYNLVEDGQVAMSWVGGEDVNLPDGTPLFTFTFEALENVESLRGLMNITNDKAWIEAVRYTTQMTDINLDIQSVTNTELPSASEAFELFQNRPNPFNDMTVIGFRLPVAETAVLTVMDMAGRVVLQKELEGSIGYNEFVLETNDLPAKGMYQYEVKAGAYSGVKKMITIQ